MKEGFRIFIAGMHVKLLFFTPVVLAFVLDDESWEKPGNIIWAGILFFVIFFGEVVWWLTRNIRR